MANVCRSLKWPFRRGVADSLNGSLGEGWPMFADFLNGPLGEGQLTFVDTLSHVQILLCKGWI